MKVKALIGMTLAALILAPQIGNAASKKSSGGSLETGLQGKIGLSAENIPLPGAAAAGGFSTPNALGVRYWNSDTFGLEGALMIQNTSNAASGQSQFGLLGGVVINWKKPSENVLIQWVARGSFLSSGTSTTPATGPAVSTSSSTFNLYGGIGFEAFVPAWQALSLSGGMGLNFSSGGASGATTTSFGTSNYGAAPINVAIHYYFD